MTVGPEGVTAIAERMGLDVPPVGVDVEQLPCSRTNKTSPPRVTTLPRDQDILPRAPTGFAHECIPHQRLSVPPKRVQDDVPKSEFQGMVVT